MAKKILYGMHKKHIEVSRLDIGEFGCFEFSILGASCDLITKSANKIAALLSKKMNVCYVDADHKSLDQDTSTPDIALFKDFKSYQSFIGQRAWNKFEEKQALRSQDLILVNGNHFEAKKQIVFVTNAKKESLRRKLNQLSDVAFYILDEGISELHDYLKPKYKGEPIFSYSDIEKVSLLLMKMWEDLYATINGLILVGGKSSRMKEDKFSLNYNGVEQWKYLRSEMPKCVNETFYSVASKEQFNVLAHEDLIEDKFRNLGPIGAILSAFCFKPDVAWLSIACDIPLLKSSHLDYLISNRDPSKIASCYYNPETNFPEPLITLWEPKSYPVLLQFLSLGYSCPRKVLINSDINMMKVKDVGFMKNVNTQEDRQKLESELNH